MGGGERALGRIFEVADSKTMDPSTSCKRLLLFVEDTDIHRKQDVQLRERSDRARGCLPKQAAFDKRASQVSASTDSRRSHQTSVARERTRLHFRGVWCGLWICKVHQRQTKADGEKGGRVHQSFFCEVRNDSLRERRRTKTKKGRKRSRASQVRPCWEVTERAELRKGESRVG